MLTYLTSIFRRREGGPADPIDHPEIARMSAAELADLPLPRHAAAPRGSYESAPATRPVRHLRPAGGLARAAMAA